MAVASLALLVALGGTSVAAILQLARNSVETAQLSNSAVTTSKISNNAVTTAKVRNRSLRAIDFAPGHLTTGPPGPAGLPGPAGSAGPPGTGAALAFRAVTGGSITTTSSGTFTDLPSATTTIDIQHSAAGVSAGWHTVTVQYAVNAATLLRLDDWGLTVLAMRES